MAAKKVAPAKSPKVESTFKKGDAVVKVLIGAGYKTCTVGWRVKAVTKDGVEIVHQDGAASILRYDLRTGTEIDPPIPGFCAEIIPVET